jgi:hypothetical protein
MVSDIHNAVVEGQGVKGGENMSVSDTPTLSTTE